MNLGIVGNGAMGCVVREMAQKDERIKHVFMIDPAAGESLFDVPRVDMVIDFSHPDALSGICDYLRQQKGSCGVVFATTGFTPEEEKNIRQLAEVVPVIKSSNYSYGVNTLKRILQQAVPLLAERADIEIIEKHHRRKTDAPSGTALMLADLCDPQETKSRVYGRFGAAKRSGEIGMHSIRGGTIFGEHSVIFAMKDEIIELKHTAYSKDIFARGAIEAAVWLKGKPPGLYPLEDVFY